MFQVGGVTILLDCGWDIHFDTELLEPLRDVVKRVDLVLISHPDLEHLGVSQGAECNTRTRLAIFEALCAASIDHIVDAENRCVAACLSYWTRQGESWEDEEDSSEERNKYISSVAGFVMFSLRPCFAVSFLGSRLLCRA